MNSSHFEAIDSFYNDDIILFFKGLEKDCKNKIEENLTILETVDTSELGFTPTEPQNFDKKTFKTYVK